MHGPDCWILNLGLGQGYRWQIARLDRGEKGGQGRRAIAKRCQDKRYFPFSVEVQESVPLVINKTSHYARGNLQSRGGGQKVSQQCPRVPKTVAVRARLVFPGVAPICA